MKIIETNYNKGYDVEICILDNYLPPIIKYKGKVLKPFLKQSNTKWMYPMVNIPEHGIQYCHILVANSIKQKLFKKYKLKKDFPNETIVVDHINGNVLDYSPKNLQFLTNSQNVIKSQTIKNYMKPITKRQAELLKLELNSEWFLE